MTGSDLNNIVKLKIKLPTKKGQRKNAASQNSKPRAATRKPEGKAKSTEKPRPSTRQAVTKPLPKPGRKKEGPPQPTNVNFEDGDDEVLSKVIKKKKRHSQAIVSVKCVGMILFNVVFLI